MKKFCVLDQGGNDDTINFNQNKKLFTTSFSDYYRLNFRKINDPNANIELDFPNKFSEGRCILFEKVPKNYEYYIFIDDDVIFRKKEIINNEIKWIENSNDIPKIINDFLTEYNPIHGTFYRKEDRFQELIQENIKKDVIKIKGFDVTGIFYHYTYAKLMYPIIVHGIYGVFQYHQYICHKLFPDKLMCFTKISLFNIRKGSYKNGKIKGSWELFDGKFLNNQRLENIKITNNILKDKLFYEEYYDKKIIANKNKKLINENISKESKIISINDINNIIDTNSQIYKNRKPTINNINLNLIIFDP